MIRHILVLGLVVITVQLKAQYNTTVKSTNSNAQAECGTLGIELKKDTIHT